LPSFPTRRSSDLFGITAGEDGEVDPLATHRGARLENGLGCCGGHRLSAPGVAVPRETRVTRRGSAITVTPSTGNLQTPRPQAAETASDQAGFSDTGQP